MKQAIKYYRESQNMTQEQLAIKLDVTRSAVAMWETGTNMPRSERLHEIARVLNCSIDELLSEDVNKHTEVRLCK